MSPAFPTVAAHGLSKAYAGVRALHDVSITLEAGKVHALLGENGAGKSTLIKILAGAVAPDAGAIEVAGQPITLAGPADAQAAGLSFVHQNPSLVGNMSLAENMFLGTPEFGRRGLTRGKQLRRRFREVSESIGLSAHPAQIADRTPMAQQTLVAIGKAIVQDAKLIVMDEPTATFSDQEAASLFELIARLIAEDRAILYVSHRLAEVGRLADTVTVLRDGQHITTLPREEIVDRDHLVRLIVGKENLAAASIDRPPPKLRERPLLEAERVSDGGLVRDGSISVHPGEIVGLAGLVGSGRTEFARVLFGASPQAAGVIRVKGTARRFRSPRQAIRAGMGMVCEDRTSESVVLEMSLRENVTLNRVAAFAISRWLPVIRGREERRHSRELLQSLGVKFASTEQPLKDLSGGNQQKLVIAKWSALNPTVLICDEPTQGVDVGAKQEIYNLLRRVAAGGAGIVLISSDIEEVVSQTDRVFVMREGVVVAEVEGATEAEVLAHCYAETTTQVTARNASPR